MTDIDWAELAAAARDIGGVLCDNTAARFWLLPAPRMNSPEFTIGRNRSRIKVEGAVLHRRVLPDDDWCVYRGVPVTTPMRTAVDLARSLPYAAGVAVIDSLLNQRLVAPEVVARAALTVMGPGSPAVRRACAHADGRSASPPETQLRLWFSGCPELGPVIPQFRLTPDGHPYDLGLPWSRTLVEYQSWEFHGQRAVWRPDARFGNEAAVAGYRYVQVVHEDMLHGREHVLAMVTG